MPPLSPPRVRGVYDRIGRAQDWQAFYEDTATARLIEIGGLGDATAVVELGCGTGRFAASLLSDHLPGTARYLGIDISPRMVALATNRLKSWTPRAEVRRADIGRPLPAVDAAYDRFVANYVFDLLDADGTRVALDEAHRVLRSGGRLCVSGLTQGVNRRSRMLARLWTRIWRRWPAVVGGCRPIAMTKALDPSRWEIERREVVVAWATPSEVIVATRR